MERTAAKASVIRLTIPTYPEAEYETLPMFAETRNHQGTSGNPFPNAVTAVPCAEEPVDVTYDAVVLENRWLEVTVLPALGGRIFSAKDKRNGYDFFYRQHVIKPALIGDLGSWISGGVEFNWPFHHRPATYMPVDWTIEEGQDGSVTVWLSDTDPFYRMRGTVGICLRPDRIWVETKVRVTNPTELRHPFLWWENAAVSINENYRLFFPHDVDHVVHHYRTCSAGWPIAKGDYGGGDFGEGTDISRIFNAPHATSYFAAPSRFDFFGGYDEGKKAGVVHVADHHIAPGKKMFTWGQDQNARDWEKKLTDTDGPYCELMAGTYTDNQPDFTWLEPYETKKFSQFWIPLSETGCPDYADLNTALTVHGSRVTIQTTGGMPKMQLRVYSPDGGLLLEGSVPGGDPGTFTFPLSESVDAGDRWRAVVLCGGETVSEYVNETFPKQEPRILRGYPLPAEVTSPYEAYRLGEHLLQYRDPRSDAEVYFRRALELDPKSVPASLSLAECHLARGLYAEAEAELREAIRVMNAMNQNPESGRASYLLGLALENQGKLGDAYDCFRKAAWSDDTAGRALTRAAVLASRSRDWKTAKKLAADALGRGSGNPAAMTLLVMIAAKTGCGETFAPLSGAFRLDPALGWAMTVRGDLEEDAYFAGLRRPERSVIETACFFREAGFEEEAQRLLDGAIRRWDSLSASVYYLAGKKPVRLTAGRTFPHLPAEAQVLRKAAADGDKYAAYLLGVLLFGQRRYEEAEKQWTDEEHRAPLRGRALCLWRKGERKAALALLFRAFEAEPFDPGDDKAEVNAIVWETAYLMNAEGEDAEKTAALVLSSVGGDLNALRDDTALELCRAWCRAGKADKALRLLRDHHFRPGEGSEAAIAVRYIDAQCGKADMLRADGDLKGAMEAYAAAKSIPDWLDGSIGGEAPFLRAVLGEAECALELAKSDVLGRACAERAEKTIRHAADRSPDALLRARLYLRLGLRDEAKKLLTEKIASWKTELAKRDSGYYASQPAYLSYLEPSEAERERRFAPLIRQAESLLTDL